MDRDMILILQLFGPDAAAHRAPMTEETRAAIDQAGIECLSDLPEHPAGLFGALSLLSEEESERRGREVARKCREAIRAQLTDMAEDEVGLLRRRAALQSDITGLEAQQAELESRLR
jgi:hypothetical protein